MRIHLASLTNGYMQAVLSEEKPKYTLCTFVEGAEACDLTIQISPLGVEGFLLDSGAFSFMSGKKCTQESLEAYQQQYIDYINSRNVKYFFELDVDTIFGLDFVHKLRKKLEAETNKKCIPVWHKSRGIEYWKRMVDEYDYVAIGGLVFHVMPKEYELIRKMVAYARAKGVKVHGLGFTKTSMLEKFAFWSVDSTSYKMAAIRGGGIHIFDGSRIRQKILPPSKFKRDIYSIIENNIREWVKYQNYMDNRPW